MPGVAAAGASSWPPPRGDVGDEDDAPVVRRAADSTTVAARFSEGRADGDAHAVLQRLAVTVRDELRLGSVEITADGMEPVVVGTPTVPRTRPRSTIRGAERGRSWSPPGPASDWPNPTRALERIGHYLAVTAEAIRVNDDLRAAQQALQNAYAEERRRVRLDLHDGIGPTLATIRLKLLALIAGVFRPSCPSTTVTDQTSDAIREVRRIVEAFNRRPRRPRAGPGLQILVADTRSIRHRHNHQRRPELPDIPAHIAAPATG